MAYVAFVFDVFSRGIVGWRAATPMTTDLVVHARDRAIQCTRRRAGFDDLAGLVHQADVGA